MFPESRKHMFPELESIKDLNFCYFTTILGTNHFLFLVILLSFLYIILHSGCVKFKDLISPLNYSKCQCRENYQNFSSVKNIL